MCWKNTVRLKEIDASHHPLIIALENKVVTKEVLKSEDIVSDSDDRLRRLCYYHLIHTISLITDYGTISIIKFIVTYIIR